MELPINERELNIIIDAMRFCKNTALYQKLWTYKLNYFDNKKEEKK